MPKQVIDIPLAAGLETRDDAKLVPPTRLLDLQNAVFPKGNATQKRNGYTALNQLTLAASPVTISAAKKLTTRGNELVLLDGSRCYGYSEQYDRWLDRGELLLLDTAVTRGADTVTTQPVADCGTANNITVTAWERPSSVAAQYEVLFTVHDQLTGVTLHPVTLLGSDFRSPRVLVMGSIVLILFHDRTANDLKVKRIDTSSAANLATSLGSAVIALGYADIHDTNTPHAYSMGTYAVFATRTTGGGTPIRVGVLLPSGAVATNADGYGNAAVGPTQTAPGQSIAVHVNASNVGLMAWGDGADVKTCSLTNIVTGAGAITFGAAHALGVTGTTIIQSVTCLADTTTDNGHVWYTGNNAASEERTGYAYTTGGVLSNQATRYWVSLASHAAYIGTKACVNVFDTSGKAFALCDGAFLPFATVHPGVAYDPLGNGSDWFSIPSFTNLSWAAVYQTRLGNANLVYLEPSVSRVSYSTSGEVSAVDASNILLVGSGLLWRYDGTSPTEVGFLSAPVKTSAVASNSTGTLTSSSVYTYAAYWEWSDSLGNRELSTAAGAFTVSLGATDDTVVLKFRSLPITHKLSTRAPTLLVYRSAANGTTRYLVSSRDPANARYVANSPSVVELTWTDTSPDSAVTGNEIDPLSPADQLPLDNVMPHGMRALHQNQERVWGVSRLYTRRVYYSKLPQAETSVEWNDGLYIEFPEDITGIADVLGRPVFFSADHVFAVDGEGPDNLGAGQYSRVEQLPADVGLYQASTLQETPLGWLFLSRKGFRLLTHGLQVAPAFGNEPNSYIGQTFTGAELIASANSVRFLTSSGSTLHYDYERNFWSRFTNHTGVSSCVWKGTYCYATSAGLVRKEASGTYTEGGSNIAQRWETSWIRLAGIQGFFRALRFALLGNHRSTHTYTVEIAYDDVDTYVETVTVTPTAGQIAGTQAYQNRHRLGRQKCNSVKFRITEVPGTGAGLELNALALEIRIKDGINRLGDRTI